MNDDWPPPYEYLGRATAWLRITREYGDPIPHFHHCPECYEGRPCDLRCTLEPDLEEKEGPYGSHMVCRQCRGDLTPEQFADFKVCKEQLRLFEELGA